MKDQNYINLRLKTEQTIRDLTRDKRELTYRVRELEDIISHLRSKKR